MNAFNVRQARETLVNLVRWCTEKILIYVDPFIMQNERDIESIIRDAMILKSSGADISVVCQAGKADRLRQYMLWHDECSRLAVHEIDDEEALMELLHCLSIAKLFLLCEADGVFNKGSLITEMNDKEAYLLSSGDSVTGDVHAKLVIAIHSCRAGVRRIHMINCKRRQSFLEELLTGKGCGTMVYCDGTTYKSIRPAAEDDVCEIAQILRTSTGDKVTENSISDLIEKYLVFAVDGYIHAVAMVLHECRETSVIKYLVSSETFETSESLKPILLRIIEEAKERGKKNLVITYYNAPAIIGIQPWFLELGFKRESIKIGGNEFSPVSKDWIKKL
jgi:N-acetylglutamate synthase-like GNAT family acetyltransferase